MHKNQPYLGGFISLPKESNLPALGGQSTHLRGGDQPLQPKQPGKGAGHLEAGGEGPDLTDRPEDGDGGHPALIGHEALKNRAPRGSLAS